MACPACKSDDLVQIELAPNGRPLLFATCRNCEHRWWSDREGSEALTLDEVLTAVARRDAS